MLITERNQTVHTHKGLLFSTGTGTELGYGDDKGTMRVRGMEKLKNLRYGYDKKTI
ncbi:hypothetical protein HanIR_Chr05g0246291 [Helianthus annuus]|nr:hypothetical protein HanIR_Chr05g0246291 [Helianthus annuus]